MAAGRIRTQGGISGVTIINFAYEVNKARAEDTANYSAVVELAKDMCYGRQIQVNEGKKGYMNPYALPERDWSLVKPYFSFVNITRMITNKLAGGIYDKAPYRAIEREGPEIEAVKWNWANDRIYQDMAEINAMKKLLGDLLLMPRFDDVLNRARFMEYTPDQYRIFQDPDWPDRAKGYAIQFSASQTVELINKNVTYTFIWTPEKYGIAKDIDLNDAGILDLATKDNPYSPYIPIIHLKDQREVGTGTIYGVGLMNELVPANMVLNLLLTAFNLLTKNQALATLVLKNITEESLKNFQFGIGRPLILNQKVIRDGTIIPEANYISPVADTEKLKLAIETFCGAIFAQFGLRNNNPLKIDMGTPESGIAKWIADAEVRTQQYKQVPSMALAEREMIHGLLMVNAAEKQRSIPDWIKNQDYIFTVDFYEQRQPMTAAERIALEDHLMATGQKSVLDLIIENNADIRTHEAALEYYMERKEHQRQIAEPLPDQNGEPEEFI